MLPLQKTACKREGTFVLSASQSRREKINFMIGLYQYENHA